jgi:L-iditol 2-dehydrogenase
MMQIRAAVLPAPRAPVELRRVAVPDLEPDSALLDVELSEVCGTDVHLQQGRLAGVPYPIVPGHVSVGRLGRIRGRVLDLDGRPFAEGDRVTFLDVHRTCNACWYCLVAKASTRCPERRVYGITYGLEDGLAGGWAEKLYLKPGTRCIRLDGIEPETFMAGGCSLPTALHAVERGQVRLGERVLVLGSGPVGLSCIILARLSSASQVLCIGAPAARLESAAQAGAAATLDFEAHDDDTRLDWVRAHTAGRGADVTIEATGAPAAVVFGMRATRDGGRVVVAGQYTDHGEASFNPHLDLNRKHLDVRGCWGSDFAHFHRGVELLRDPERARLWSVMLPQRFPLARVQEALDAVAAGRVVKAFVVPAAAPPRSA